MPLNLKPFFADPDWHHRFDEHILAHGQKLSSPRFLTALNLEPIEDGYLLTGQVDGHDAEINLWPESETHWEFDTACTCDFGTYCPHSAAALLRAARPNTLARLLRGGGSVAPVRTKSPVLAQPVSSEKFEPTFHIEVSEEPASTRVVQLLLQVLKTKRRETWLVARPVV